VAYLKRLQYKSIINEEASTMSAHLIILTKEVTSMTDTTTIASLLFECTKQLTRRTVQPQLRLKSIV